MDRNDQARFGLEYGHSPVAHRVACVDFDGTIVPWKPVEYVHKRANRGAAKAIRAMKKAGFTIVIFTSRMSPLWWQYAGEDGELQRIYVEDTLDRLNIPYDMITGEKVPAEVYIDDKAIEYTDNWEEIMERVIG